MPDYKNRAYLLTKDRLLVDALDDIMNSILHTQIQTNVDASGLQQTPPPSIQALAVVSSQGVFDAAISDNASSVTRGINYFLEYSLSPSFSAPVVIDLGASRNWRGFLGNQTFYFRAYSAYPTSRRSIPVYFGTESNPNAVLGGGALVGPDPLPSSGSGTSFGAKGNDGGFGNNQTR